MESQPQNPEFRNNPENFHPCICVKSLLTLFHASHNFCYLLSSAYILSYVSILQTTRTQIRLLPREQSDQGP